MYRLFPSNTVRRCLFPDADALIKDAANDNLVNLYREILIADTESMQEKYNYDFKNDKPLEGNVQWYPDGKDRWIGVVGKAGDEKNGKGNELDIVGKGKEDVKAEEDVQTEIVDSEDNPEDPLQMKKENEVTPKSNTRRTIPLDRKRRNVEAANVEGVKRKISLE